MSLELDVTYAWPAGGAVGPLRLDVQPGERVLLTGRSGSGKSTLLRLAAGLLQRHGAGRATGIVTVDGRDPSAVAPAERAGTTAFVAQEPGDQVVAGTLADEIAFGLECAGWDAARIEARITEVLELVGLQLDPARAPTSLSGGQLQRLVAGAALAGGAPLLLLDEPLSQLDADGAEALLRHLADLSDTAIVLVEHRLEPTLPWATRVVVLEDGEVAADVAPEVVDAAFLRERGLVVPGRLALHAALEQGARVQPSPPAEPGVGDVVCTLTGARVDGRLHGVDLVVHAGERVAVLGANGAGKSTLLGLLDGLLVPQEPDLTLFCDTVADELSYGPTELGIPPEPGLAERFSLQGLLDRSPQALSRGQRLRTAVAAALACRPAVLLLDEPTAGQDHDAVEGMMQALVDGLDGALIFATHDVDLALRHATRFVVLADGRKVADGGAEVLVDAIRLPPLAAWCVEQGYPPMSLKQLLGGG